MPYTTIDDRLTWVHAMRAKFSPAAMIASDASINQDFFKPDKVPGHMISKLLIQKRYPAGLMPARLLAGRVYGRQEVGQPREGPFVQGKLICGKNTELSQLKFVCLQVLLLHVVLTFWPTCVRSCQGLEQHGIGKWREISEKFLPRWDDQALRLKAVRLMGSQSLARYIGWKGSKSVPASICLSLPFCRSTNCQVHHQCSVKASQYLDLTSIV